MEKVWEFLKDSIPKFQAIEESTEEKTTSGDFATARDSQTSQATDCKSDSPTLKEKHKGTELCSRCTLIV